MEYSLSVTNTKGKTKGMSRKSFWSTYASSYAFLLSSNSGSIFDYFTGIVLPFLVLLLPFIVIQVTLVPFTSLTSSPPRPSRWLELREESISLAASS
jgi:hypothetical protein